MSMFDRVQELEAEVARGLENTPPAVNSPAAPLSARKAGMSAYQAAEAKRRKAVAAERERRQAEKLAAAEKAKERAEFVKATLKRSHEAKAKKRHNDLRFMEKLRKQADGGAGTDVAGYSYETLALARWMAAQSCCGKDLFAAALPP